MADINMLSIFGATKSVKTWSAGAAEITVGLGSKGDSRAVLLVDNRNTDVIARVNIEAGDGIRAALGDLDVDVAVSSLAAIPLNDSMRFKDGAANTTYSGSSNITVNLNDTSDTALTATPLGNIKVALIQG